MATVCPHCTAVNRPEAIFCNACGRPLGSESLPACVACNAVLRPGTRFCHRCGHKQATAEIVAPAPEDAAPAPDGNLCAACGQSNRPEARFCRQCRAPLTVTCDNCGRENRVAAKFCLECGLSLAAGASSTPAEPHLGETTPPNRRPSAIICEFCGATLRAGERFCAHCGGSPTAQQPSLLDRFATGQIPRGYKLIGSQGAEYLILRLIAQGGMGAVYEVGRMGDGTRCVLTPKSWTQKEST